jgi:ABC-type transporter lipoprotein component MlaA
MGFDGVSVDLEKYKGAYSRFLELAGKEVKHPAWGLTSKELLNEIVTGNHTLSQVYDMKSDGPDGGKYHFVRDILEQYREYAKTELLKEYPQIKDEADERKSKKRELKMPVFGG